MRGTLEKSLRQTCAVLLTLASLADVAGAAENSRPSLPLTPCRLPQLSRPARCGSLQVPENPEQPNGRHLSIAVAVVPAVGGPALPDPVVVLMGGPEKTPSAPPPSSLKNSRRCCRIGICCSSINVVQAAQMPWTATFLQGRIVLRPCAMCFPCEALSAARRGCRRAPT